MVPFVIELTKKLNSRKKFRTHRKIGDETIVKTVDLNHLNSFTNSIKRIGQKSEKVLSLGNFYAKLSKTPGYDRGILRPPFLLNMPFRKTKA